MGRRFLLVERERFRQFRLHALERWSRDLREHGQHAAAIDAGLAAVAIEPLRESAQVMLIRAHLAEGNVSEAFRQIDRYRRLLDEELGIGLSPTVTDLVSSYQKGSRFDTSAGVR